MFSTQPQLNLQKTASGGHSPLRARPGFSGKTEATVARELAEQALKPLFTPEGFWGKRIHPFAESLANIKLQFANMSLEDWASRLNTIFAIYLPQTAVAFAKSQHVWETLGRNVLVWCATLAVVAYNKNDTYSVNTLVFDKFMRPADPALPELVNLATRHSGKIPLAEAKKLASQYPGSKLAKALVKTAETAGQSHVSGPGFWSKVQHKMGLSGDYFALLERAGVRFSEKDRKKAYWASIDANEVDKIQAFAGRVAKKLESSGKHDAALLGDKKLAELVPSFLNRLKWCKLGSTAVITALIAVVVGKVTMDIVFKFIAPLDHDFDPNSAPGAKPKPKLPPRPVLPSRLITSGGLINGNLMESPSPIQSPAMPAMAFHARDIQQNPAYYPAFSNWPPAGNWQPPLFQPQAPQPLYWPPAPNPFMGGRPS
ncbi:MAG: YppG family protein [Cyanobacteria bacterium]|nr:YppG family protein [Cyanobacteriota bacterium]